MNLEDIVLSDTSVAQSHLLVILHTCLISLTGNTTHMFDLTHRRSYEHGWISLTHITADSNHSHGNRGEHSGDQMRGKRECGGTV